MEAPDSADGRLGVVRRARWAAAILLVASVGCGRSEPASRASGGSTPALPSDSAVASPAIAATSPTGAAGPSALASPSGVAVPSAASPSGVVAPSPAGTASPSGVVASAAPSSAPAASAASVAPEYSAEGIAPLPESCRDVRAVLGTALDSDESLMRHVRQALVAHPEVEVVDGAFTGPRQVQLWWTGHGIKYFKEVEKNRYAPQVRCTDGDTCRRVAAMVRAVVPAASKPRLFCGTPPTQSGGELLRHGPWRGPAALPAPGDRAAVCGRVTACGVRLGEDRDQVARACPKHPLAAVARCAASEDCREVTACWRELPPPPATTSHRTLPPPATHGESESGLPGSEF